MLCFEAHLTPDIAENKISLIYFLLSQKKTRSYVAITAYFTATEEANLIEKNREHEKLFSVC